MHNFLRPTLVSFALTLALTACDDAPGSDPDEDVAPREWVSCPKCQHNAASVNGVPLGYLDLTGEPNEQGIAIAYLRRPEGGIYDFGVKDEEIVAYEDGEVAAIGSELIDWELVLLIDGHREPIRITTYDQRKSLAKNEEPISVYGLEATGEDQQLANICPGHKPGTASVTLLHGETYDAEHKVIDKVGPQWVTLACADEAIFKMKLMGYGPHGRQGPGGALTTPAQRTATFKMITADYCGTGKSYTIDGAKVLWSNRSRTVVTSTGNGKPSSGQIVTYEAAWTEKGAVCLTRPRAVKGYGPKPCSKLPDCKDYLKGSPPPHEWVTYVPYFN